STKVRIKMAVEIVTDSIVSLACARHRINLAVKILVSDFALSLHLEILGYRHSRAWFSKRHSEPPTGGNYTRSCGLPNLEGPCYKPFAISSKRRFAGPYQ